MSAANILTRTTHSKQRKLSPPGGPEMDYPSLYGEIVTGVDACFDRATEGDPIALDIMHSTVRLLINSVLKARKDGHWLSAPEAPAPAGGAAHV